MVSVLPSYAQSTPTTGGGTTGLWTGGPDSAGANTYVGRIEAPRARATIQAGANLLVSGWAADTTASGWSGFDQMQVYNGDRTKGGSKVADGMVGLARADIGEILGPNFATSGFAAVVKASAIPAGAATLYVYLHTASKGWWYRTLPVTQAAAPVLPFPTDPIIDILKPNSGQVITQQQFGATQEYVITGFALDRNPQLNPNGPPKTNSPYAGPGNVGIQSITLYLDKLPGQPGYNPDVNLFGGQIGGPPSPAIFSVSPNDVHVGFDPCQSRGALKYCQSAMSLTNSYGPNYTFAGWVSFFNQRVVQPDMFHTIYAVALSSVTGRTSMAQADIYVKSYPSSHPPCSLFNFFKKGTVTTKNYGCAILSG